jgi:isocitrate lyase
MVSASIYFRRSFFFFTATQSSDIFVESSHPGTLIDQFSVTRPIKQNGKQQKKKELYYQFHLTLPFAVRRGCSTSKLGGLSWSRTNWHTVSRWLDSEES